MPPPNDLLVAMGDLCAPPPNDLLVAMGDLCAPPPNDLLVAMGDQGMHFPLKIWTMHACMEIIAG